LTDIQAKLTEILESLVEIDTNNITLESKLIDDLGLDSLDTVELIIELETEFKICIEDSEAFELKTVKDVITMIERNK